MHTLEECTYSALSVRGELDAGEEHEDASVDALDGTNEHFFSTDFCGAGGNVRRGGAA